MSIINIVKLLLNYFILFTSKDLLKGEVNAISSHSLNEG